MKKSILALLALLYFNCSYSQSKIEGLGNLKIGVSLKNQTIDSLKTLLKMDTTAVLSGEEQSQKGYYILLVAPDTINFKEEVYSDIYNKKVAVYFIPKLLISDIKIKDIRIYFYNDTLYKIECEGSSSLSDALKAKYGEPKEKVETKPVSCISTVTGKLITEKDMTIIDTWENKKILAQDILIMRHNSKCQPGILSNLTIIDLIKANNISNASKLIYKSMKIADDKKKSDAAKAKLKDF